MYSLMSKVKSILGPLNKESELYAFEGWRSEISPYFFLISKKFTFWRNEISLLLIHKSLFSRKT